MLLATLALSASLTACAPTGISNNGSPNRRPSATSSVRPSATNTAKTPSPASNAPAQGAESGDNNTRDQRVVVKVIDGDTIDVARPGETAKERIRLIGVDTPETKDPRKPVQCFGKEASEFTSRLMGRTVWLEYDVEPKDRYGRTLAYVFLDDGAFFNLILAEEGYAQPLTIPPNVRYADRFVEAARRAREEGRGLWSSCG